MSESIKTPSLQNKKVLVIDDDLTQLKLITGILSKFGLIPLPYQDPLKALQDIYNGTSPDIIITDIFMPEMNGWELCRILRSELFPTTQTIPILIISSQILGEETKKLAQDAGANDFIILPAEPETLFNKIQNAISNALHPEIIQILLITPCSSKIDTGNIQNRPSNIHICSVHSPEEAYSLLQEKNYNLIVISSEFLSQNSEHIYNFQNSAKNSIILTLLPENTANIPNLQLSGISGTIKEPLIFENLITLYEKIQLEKTLIQTREALEQKIREGVEGEIKWASILDALPIGVFVKDTNLSYIRVNKTYSALFHKEPIDFILQREQEFWDEASITKFKEACLSALDGNIYFHPEWELSIHKKNHLFLTYIAPIKTKQGKITGVYGTLTDITNIKETQENYKRLFETMEEAFAEHEIIYDTEGIPIDYKFITANPGFEKMTGLKPEQVIGKTVKTVLPHIDSSWIEIYSSVVASGKSITFEKYAEALDRYYIVHAYKTGEKRFACIFTDITEKKKFEQEIRKLNREWQLTFDNINSVIWLLDKNFQIRKTNGTVTKLLKLTQDEVIGKKCWEVVHGTITPPDFCPVLKLIKTKKRETLEFSRGENWYEAIVDPVFDEQQQLIGYLHILSDITEKKQREKELAELQQQLFQSQKLESIGRLAGGMAHDFNNMLGVILGNVELAILKSKLNEPIEEHLIEARNAVEKSAEIIKKILTFAQKRETQPKLLDLNTEIKNYYSLLKRLLPENIQLKFHHTENLWKVNMDPSQLDIILLNLCVNARDAIVGQGTITITTENTIVTEKISKKHPDAQPGEYVKLSVSDTGTGIPPEVLPKIFDPFFTTKKHGMGSGLGLSTVYGAVKQNNGFIIVQTQLHKGTTFEVYLPRSHSEKPHDQTVHTMLPPVEVLSSNLYPEQQYKILIVDDEQSITDILSQIITKLGFIPIATNNPNEALNILTHQKEKINVAILDLVLPDIDGNSLAKKMKEIHPELKIIFMSGYFEHPSTEITEKQEFYINKPFSIAQLTEKLSKIILKP